MGRSLNLILLLVNLLTSITFISAIPHEPSRRRRGIPSSRQTALLGMNAFNVQNESFKERDYNKEDFRVSNLPFTTKEVQDIESYAGYLPVDKKSNANYFFWYFPPTRGSTSKSDDNLLVWLNGGPGASSLYGLLSLNGPLRGKPDQRLHENPYTWSKLSHILYLEQPGNVGYSYMDKDKQPTNEKQVANLFLNFMLELYKTFPDLRSKKLYIAGESYAGAYIPNIAERILSYNDRQMGQSSTSKEMIPLAGISLGNPWLDPIRQYESYGPYLDTIQFFGRNQTARREFKSLQDACVKSVRNREPYSTDNCDRDLLGYIDDYLAEINQCFNDEDVRVRDCDEGEYFSESKFMNDLATRKAINIEGTFADTIRWSTISTIAGDALDADGSKAYITLLPHIAKRIPVTVYDGDQDFICNHLGVEWAIGNLTWNGAKGFKKSDCHAWYIPDQSQPAGHQCSSRNLTYVRVFNGSHAVPETVPKSAYALIHDIVLKE